MPSDTASDTRAAEVDAVEVASTPKDDDGDEKPSASFTLFIFIFLLVAMLACDIPTFLLDWTCMNYPFWPVSDETHACAPMVKSCPCEKAKFCVGLFDNWVFPVDNNGVLHTNVGGNGSAFSDFKVLRVTESGSGVDEPSCDQRMHAGQACYLVSFGLCVIFLFVSIAAYIKSFPGQLTEEQEKDWEPSSATIFLERVCALGLVFAFIFKWIAIGVYRDAADSKLCLGMMKVRK